MSSNTSYTACPMSERRFSRLASILTEANTHHSAVAAAVRAAAKPTFHARTRAQKLGLKVDTVRAVALPAHCVSVVPPPIIDTTPSPPPIAMNTNAKTKPTRPTLRLLVPRALPDVPVSGGPHSTLSLSLTAAEAPMVLHGQNNLWRGPTSRFSVTPDDPIFMLAPRRAPLPPVALAPAPTEAPVVPDVPFDEDDLATWELGYPPSGAADYAPSAESIASNPSSFTASTFASSSGSGSSSSGSSSDSSDASSPGPATPADADMPLAPATGKRMRRCEDDATHVEKRPKYERKSWVRGRSLC
ncbi:hypothetical protein FB451DRAFT_1380294 [Mycena latifolia]|nr:hypothetical protein FB451DRAFT_1380294 [Mycena latifolia]